MFVCAAASSLSVLKGLEEFQGDYVDLMDKTDRFLEFYGQRFLSILRLLSRLFQA